MLTSQTEPLAQNVCCLGIVLHVPGLFTDIAKKLVLFIHVRQIWIHFCKGLRALGKQRIVLQTSLTMTVKVVEALQCCLSFFPWRVCKMSSVNMTDLLPLLDDSGCKGDLFTFDYHCARIGIARMVDDAGNLGEHCQSNNALLEIRRINF